MKMIPALLILTILLIGCQKDIDQQISTAQQERQQMINRLEDDAIPDALESMLSETEREFQVQTIEIPLELPIVRVELHGHNLSVYLPEGIHGIWIYYEDLDKIYPIPMEDLPLSDIQVLPDG